MYGCIKYRFDILSAEVELDGEKFEYEITWSEIEEHMGERGFCKHPCAESGGLEWLFRYREGSLTYCPTCRHYGILVRNQQ